ncbi:hypothetical protein DOTSEDRAFT_75102 [Dothistroma septosporum NZE10]|uniref:F-box domain-containing protein n=1 Tax=Dothistroma septosporum (strain NZE10 / CBS 128990) TaxID=675120 RepID=M2Y1T1_DOTSN|nr:hypothetical protein DOTSEDRAFT_75102 [Dothistroma septosporum NZE10]
MSADSLRREGRLAYDNEDYAKALELFRRAVKRGDASAQLLDHLAATHDKLKDLEAALQAAKKTIQTWSEDPIGYLRAGRLLIKMERKSTALDIYNHALKKIKHVGMGYEKLKTAQAAVLKEIAPPKSVDPLTMLPREMALIVLEHLSFRQRTAISRVSKGWRNFIRSEPNLWAHLDFTGARAKVTNRFVSTAINIARDKLVAATLNQLLHFDKVLHALAGRPALQSLTLLGTGLQGQNLVSSLAKAKSLRELRISRGTEVSQSILQFITRDHCDKLEVLQCVGIKQISFGSIWNFKLPVITTLDITAECTIDPAKLCDRLSESSPNLRSLTLYETTTRSGSAGVLDLRRSHNLEHVRMRLMLSAPHQLCFPPTIKSIDLGSSCGGYVGRNFFGTMGHSDNDPGLEWSKLPDLEEVRLDFPGAEFTCIVRPFGDSLDGSQDVSGISKLKSLSMAGPNIATNTIIKRQERLSDLEHWAITGCQDLNDLSVDTMLRNYKKLRSLDFSGSSITGVAIKEIVKAGHVKELTAYDCLRVGRDAVDWARGQGLKVHFGSPNIQDTGKKVRY